MKRITSAIVGVATGALCIATSAHAQQAVQTQSAATNKFAVDASLGFAVPQSPGSVGVDVMAAGEWHPPIHFPLWARFEFGFNHFGTSVANVSANEFRFVLDAVFPAHLPGTAFTPYLLGGIGLYDGDFSVNNCQGDACSNSSVGFGFNFGAGARYPVGPVQPFFELRFHPVVSGSVSNLGTFQFGARYQFP